LGKVVGWEVTVSVTVATEDRHSPHRKHLVQPDITPEIIVSRGGGAVTGSDKIQVEPTHRGQKLATGNGAFLLDRLKKRVMLFHRI